MIKLVTTICIDAPVASVWARLAKLEDIQLWSASVLRARCEGTLSHGVGAERTCDLAGNLTIRERWLAWEEGTSFQYEGYGLPWVKRATNRWSVQAVGKQTLLTSEATIEMKGGIWGRLLEPVMGLMARRMAPSEFAGFKYLVEHGQPYSGKYSELPRPAVAC